MKRVIVLIIVTVIFPALAFCAIVSGKVSNGVTGDPVPNAYIEIYYFNPESTFVGTGYTDNDGRYLFDTVPAGTYYARSWATNLAVTGIYNLVVPNDGLILNIALYPYSESHGGGVGGGDSLPVPYATMEWKNLTSDITYLVSADANGKFSLAGLPLAPYRVTVQAAGYEDYSFSTVLQSGVLGYQIMLVSASTTGVEEYGGGTRPSVFVLNEAFPNPFNPNTMLSFTLPTQSNVRLRIFDILGREVATLVSGQRAAGSYWVEWNAQAASGLYFCRLEAASVSEPGKVFSQSKKLLLVK